MPSTKLKPKPRGRGRPRTESDEVLSESVHVKMTPSEREILERACEIERRAASQFARFAVIEAAQNVIKQKESDG